MVQSIKKLLVCTDGSDYSQVCCRYAAWIAEHTGASIDLLYLTDLRQFEVPLVADLSGSLGIQPYQDVLTHLQEMEKRKAAIIEKNAREIFAKEGMKNPIQFHHHTGLLVDCLEDFEKDVDLVLLGKRGENADYATAHLGSNMERVIRASSKPTLTTSRKFIPFTKILLAYDGGESCQKALQFLCENDALSDQELHIITVSENEDDKAAFENMEQAKSIAKGRKGTNVFQILNGNVEDQIARYVDNEEMNLLVMGVYGHRRIRYLLIGSTTTTVIRACRIPVLCFP
jgi:nucleotide-binding universal stress UspA family protein